MCLGAGGGVKTTFEKMARETRCPFAQLSHGFDCTNRGLAPQADVSASKLDNLMGKVGLKKHHQPAVSTVQQAAHTEDASDDADMDGVRQTSPSQKLPPLQYPVSGHAALEANPLG